MKRRTCSVLVVAGISMLYVLLTGSVGQAAPRNRTMLVVQTVPSLPRVAFSLDGRRFASNGNGEAQVTTTAGAHTLALLQSTVREPGLRATFDRWIDERFVRARTIRVGEGVTRVQVGFDTEYSVSLVFEDQYGSVVNPDRIQSVSFSSKNGERFNMRPTARRWVLGSTIRRDGDGLAVIPVKHYVQSVLVHGTNVVNEGQQQLIAAADRQWEVKNLLFYSAQFHVRDRFFGFPTGSSVTLEYPDGHAETHQLGSGATVTVADLPRGNYRAIVHGFGLNLSVPVTLSRDQDVRLVYLSYFDMAAAILFVLAFLVGLILVGRWRHRREPDALGASRAPGDSAPHDGAALAEVRS
jgi:hypothetical protein